MSVSTVVTVTLRIRTRYALGLPALGLHKGEWSKRKSPFVGILCGIVHFCLLATVSGHAIRLNADVVQRIAALFLSAEGLGRIVLSPVSEEVLFRGFLYNYLESSLGRFWGLMIQAGIFSLIHIAWLFQQNAETASLLVSTFVVGLVAARLYRLSNSLYPCIVYHGVINYLINVL